MRPGRGCRWLVLSHRGESWTLTRRDLAPRLEDGFEVPLLAPGLPVVDLRDASGRRVHGLIDTAAPTTHAVTKAAEGSYVLPDEAGRVRLRLDTSDTVDWRGLRVGGHRVSVLLGLNVLETLDFDLDLTGGVWRLRTR